MATDNIASQIARIQEDKSTIRNKLIELGLASSTDNLDKLANTISKIENRGAIEADVVEGTTYTIPKGYHNGAGVIHAISDTLGDGETYKTQPKTVTPTKEQQTVGPDTGFYALSSVTVNPIPEAYQDVSDVTATKADVLAGKIFVTSDGSITTGTMANNGKVTKLLSTIQSSYTIDKGYHDGTGVVSISLVEKTATPTKEQQEVIPDSLFVLSKVTVNPIPDNFADTTDATAVASQIIAGKTAYVGVNGVATKITGTMVERGQSNSFTLDGLNTKEVSIPEGFYAGDQNAVFFDDTAIVEALSAI